MKKLLITLFAFATLSWGQCGHIAFNPITGLMDCVGSASSSATVSSVGLSLPAFFTVSNSPVTTTGTLTAVMASQSANLFLASPSGSSGAPTFRALVPADVPLANTHFLVGGSGGAAADVAMSGDCSLANTGAVTCTSLNSKAVSLANSFTTSGNFALTLTTTASTNVTLPTTGTLAARLTGSGTIDFASINDGTCLNSTFTLTGAVAADAVIPEWPAAFNTSFVGTMFVSAADTIRVVACNLSGAAVDPASATYGAIIVR